MEVTDIDWNQVAADLGPRLYRYFIGSFTAPTASDAVQETLIRLVQKSRQGIYNSEQGPLAPYAFGLARMVRFEMLKKRVELTSNQPEDLWENAVDESTLPDSIRHERNIAHLRWAVRQLKPLEQELILLTIDEGLQLSEISENLNLPLGTIKSHIFRAKENLRNIMEVSRE